MRIFLFLLLPLLSACTLGAKTPETPVLLAFDDRAMETEVEYWGAMKAVLRDGETQGRVSLTEVLGPNAVAVGALQGLAAEITVVDGVTHLAEVTEAGSGLELNVRAPAEGEQATLLVLAHVESWTEHSLPNVSELDELERAVRDIAEAQGINIRKPFPFKVRGTASHLHVHVLNHSCPIADPDGPDPWTFDGVDEDVVLVGFYASDAAGVLTHHGQSSHIHAVIQAQGVSGHLDSIGLSERARLFLPAK